MLNDLTQLMTIIAISKSVHKDTRERARDVLNRIEGHWTWGCIANGVSPFPKHDLE